MVTTKVKGKVEAVSTKPGSEGIKVAGAWLNATDRTRKYVAQRKVGDMVYIELEGNGIVFCGDLKPDDPDKVAKTAQNSPQTAPNRATSAPSGQIPPVRAHSEIKPKLALSQTDRLIVAQVCLKGAIDLVVACPPAGMTLATGVVVISEVARQLEADFYRRASA